MNIGLSICNKYINEIIDSRRFGRRISDTHAEAAVDISSTRFNKQIDIKISPSLPIDENFNFTATEVQLDNKQFDG